VEDASFLKLDNVSIGYTVPLTNNRFIKSLRIYGTGQNLFTLTNYTGVDPEVRMEDKGSVDNGGYEDEFGDPLVLGIDRRNTYFTTRTFTFGVNLQF